jgi:hypothetical protein
MAQKTNSLEDVKLHTENIEYAGDLKQVDSVDGGDNAPAVIVTEEDVSGRSVHLVLILTTTSHRIEESARLSIETFSPFSSGYTGSKFWTSHCWATLRSSVFRRML